MSAVCYIYVLRDPRTLKVRYVGKTKHLKDRYWSHTVRGGNTAKDAWVAKLKEQGLVPQYDVVDICKEDNWHEREALFIQEFKKFRLLNTMVGVVERSDTTKRACFREALFKAQFYRAPKGMATAIALLEDGRAFWLYGGTHTRMGYYYMYHEATRYYVPKRCSLYGVPKAKLPKYSGRKALVMERGW